MRILKNNIEQFRFAALSLLLTAVFSCNEKSEFQKRDAGIADSLTVYKNDSAVFKNSTLVKRLKDSTAHIYSGNEDSSIVKTKKEERPVKKAIKPDNADVKQNIKQQEKPVAGRAKSRNGIFVPGNEELKAIRMYYKDVTLDKLREGHLIYAKGVCIKCHGAQNIYKRTEGAWKEIIEVMSEKAKLSDLQKDAVYKYVLAIKATQKQQQQTN
jgi:hypothetical protein